MKGCCRLKFKKYKRDFFDDNLYWSETHLSGIYVLAQKVYIVGSPYWKVRIVSGLIGGKSPFCFLIYSNVCVLGYWKRSFKKNAQIGFDGWINGEHKEKLF